MKTYRIFFVFIFLFFQSQLLFCQAALKQSVYTLGGSISFSSSKQNISNRFEPNLSTTNTIFSISPSFSYFIINNLLIGGNISFNYFEIETEFSLATSNFTSKSIQKSFGIGPSVRYYFSSGTVIPFIGISDRYTKQIDADQNGNTFLAEGGINYFLSKSVAMEPFLSYSITSFTQSDSDINTFSIGIRISYFIID